MVPERTYFYTATIFGWKHIFKHEQCKEIIIDSLRYLVNRGVVKVYAFVIMPNHIHLIWRPLAGARTKNLQLSFMKLTAQKIKFFLLDNNQVLLREFMVGAADRKYQIWQRNPLAVELYSPEVIEQKPSYIHKTVFAGN